MFTVPPLIKRTVAALIPFVLEEVSVSVRLLSLKPQPVSEVVTDPKLPVEPPPAVIL